MNPYVVVMFVIRKEINTIVKFVFNSFSSLGKKIQQNQSYKNTEKDIRLSLQSLTAPTFACGYHLDIITESNLNDMKGESVTKVKRVPRSALNKPRVVRKRRNTHPTVIHTKAFEQGISQTSTPEVSYSFSFAYYLEYFTFSYKLAKFFERFSYLLINNYN